MGSHPITAEYFATGTDLPQPHFGTSSPNTSNATPPDTVVTASANPVVLTEGQHNSRRDGDRRRRRREFALLARQFAGQVVSFIFIDTAGGPGATTTDTETLDPPARPVTRLPWPQEVTTSPGHL